MNAVPRAADLIAIVLVVIALELLALAAMWALGPRRVLARRMLPSACAGLFLALALRELQHGGAGEAGGDLPLALWLTCAGAAHGLDWWRAARSQPPRAG